MADLAKGLGLSLADFYPEKLRAKLKDLLEQPLPMEGRANFLPFQDTLPGSVMNQRSLALPGVLAGAVNAVTAPRRSAMAGMVADEDGNIRSSFDAPAEAQNVSLSMLGGGGAASRGAPAGALAMNGYHGSPKIYEKIDPSKFGTGSSVGAADQKSNVFWMTRDREEANWYAKGRTMHDPWPSHDFSGQRYKVDADIKNPYIFPIEGEHLSMGMRAAGIDYARKNGYDSVIFADPRYPKSLRGADIAVLEPQKVKILNRTDVDEEWKRLIGE